MKKNLKTLLRNGKRKTKRLNDKKPPNSIRLKKKLKDKTQSPSSKKYDEKKL